MKQKLQLLREWRASADENGTLAEVGGELEFGDCANSRYERQWWERPVSLLQFGSDLVGETE